LDADLSLGTSPVTLIGSETIIDGSKADRFSVAGGSHVVQKLKFQSFKRSGLEVINGSALRVEGCTFENNGKNNFGSGIWLRNASELHVEACTFENNFHGIYLDPDRDLTGKYRIIGNNKFLNNVYGISTEAFDGQFNGVDIQGNTFVGNTQGALSLDRGKAQIINNVFTGNCTGDCDSVVKLERGRIEATIQDNRLERNGPTSRSGAFALRVEDSGSVRVAGNTIINNELIAGNFGCGRGLASDCVAKVVLIGNRIGVDKDNKPAGNRGGIGASSGTTVGPDNIIAYNRSVAVVTSSYARLARPTITQNSIYSNSGGIAVFFGGGPEVQQLEFNPQSGSVKGRVQFTFSPEPHQIVVELFSNEVCDPRGAGKTFLKSVSLQPNIRGVAEFETSVSLPNPQEKMLTATATDSTGTGPFSNCALPDLTISRIELVQTLGDQSNSLVANKSTIARVFVGVGGSGGAPIPGVEATLRGFRDGKELPDSPLKSLHKLNGPITAPTMPQRDIIDHSLNFLLPSDWTKEDGLKLEAEVTPVKNVQEVSTDNNKLTSELVFQKRTLKVAYILLKVKGDAQGPDLNLVGNAHTLLQQLWPVSDLKYYPLDLIPREVASRGEETLPSVLADALSASSRLVEAWRPDILFGWLPGTFCDGKGNWDKKATMPDNQPPYEITVRAPTPWGSGSPDCMAKVFAHETGHIYLLSHPDTKGKVIGAVPAPGFIEDLVVNTGTQLELRQHNVNDFEMMTQGHTNDQVWISQFSWKHLFDLLPGSNRSPNKSQAGRGLVGPSLLIRGTVFPNGRADLEPIYPALSDLGSTPDGPYCLRLEDVAGQLLGTQCFNVNVVDDDLNPLDAWPFAQVIPRPVGLAKIALVHEGRVLAQRQISSRAPVVSITSPTVGETWDGSRSIRWTAQDEDGDSLRYMVLYSPDNRQSWRSVALDLEAMEYVLDTNLVPGGDGFWVRVVATDGLNTGSHEIGPTRIPKKGPRVFISSPQREATFGPGMPVLLQGTAFDFEDVGISDENLTWTSDRDGLLGVGSLLQLTTLSPGTHRVTLRAQDSDRNMGEASVAIHIASGATIEVMPTSLNFENVIIGGSRSLALTVRNTGTSPLTVSAISSNAQFSVVSPTTSFTVSAGGQQTVTVQFTPSAVGAQTATLTITSNAASTPTVTVSLTGNGVAPAAPNIDVMPTSLDFGSVTVGQSRDLTLMIRNLGSAGLAVNAITNSNAPFKVAAPPTPFTVPAGDTITFTVRFAPTAASAQSGILSIASNDPDEATVMVPLTGTGSSSGATLTVSRTPGAAVFTSIQAAINAAGAGATIEIIDSATYQEDVEISASKSGLTLLARSGQTPTVRGVGDVIITVEGAQNVTLRGLRLTGGADSGLVTDGPTVRNLTVQDCRFEAIPNIAIELSNQDTATLRGNIFTNLGGSGIFMSEGASATITGNAFRGGSMNGRFSDGIELVGASADIIGNTFIGVGRIAIGTFLQDAAAPLRTSTIRIINNLIAGSGSAIPQGGDGIQVVSSANTTNQFTIVNNTLANNARLGIGFGLDGPQSRVTLANTIIIGSRGPGDFQAYDTTDPNQAARITIRNCLIGRDPAFNSIGRNGNITGDPRFIDANGNNYRLQSGSRAIDVGDNSAIAGFTVDLDGNARIADGDRNGIVTVDLGAYEFQP
jgi:hypothetical protein